MTIQLASSRCAKSKHALRIALEENPDGVFFDDPTPAFLNGRGYFPASDMTPGESFPIVMDPQTRRRFAKVTRTKTGAFKVE